MAVGQRESGRAVVECGVQPGVEGMAGLASGGEICRHVIGIRGLLKIRQVARRARGRESLILSYGGVSMALLALHHGVRSEQREPVEVVFDRLNRYIPTQNRVALGAVGAILATMNVRVAVGAILADIGEHRLGMALGAINLLVHSPKGISCSVVIEFGKGANRAPTCAGVAILARNRQTAMGTFLGLPLGIRRPGKTK